jgi:hypothetical protein
MSAEITILQIKDKSLDELGVLLNSKEFINSSAKEKLSFFKQIDQESNKPLFIALAVKSIEHLNLLLNNDLLVKVGHDFCFELVQIQDQNKVNIIELVSKKAVIINLEEVLNSRIFKDILYPDDIYKIFAEPNRLGISGFALLMNQSFQHFKTLLESQAFKKINEDQAFKLLNLPSDETGTLNSFWNAILKGEEYWGYLFNSRFLDKLNSKEISHLLATHYEEDNGDIPLGYVINHLPEESIEKFLASKAYKKLNSNEEYNQYKLQNDNNMTALDIALNKSPEAFRSVLECQKCFNILTDDQRLYLLTTKDNRENLPIVYKALVIGNEYENLILNSEVIVSMAQEQKYNLLHTALHSNINVINDEAPDPEIVGNPERLGILRNSAVFQSLDLDKQQQLLGQHVEVLKDNSTDHN